jgi:hypothetical protein
VITKGNFLPYDCDSDGDSPNRFLLTEAIDFLDFKSIDKSLIDNCGANERQHMWISNDISVFDNGNPPSTKRYQIKTTCYTAHMRPSKIPDQQKYRYIYCARSRLTKLPINRHGTGRRPSISKSSKLGSSGEQQTNHKSSERKWKITPSRIRNSRF